MDDELARNIPKVHADNQSIAIGAINISGTVTGNITIGHTIVQPADARLRHELGILLKNVQTTWIKGVLEKSVHGAALLELGLELREEAVDNPWRMVIERPDQSRETIPRGRKIKDIFDQANRLLLILGEPGSGKTTTLLQLARDLIAGVDQAFTQPIPVILNLSTWTNKQQPLAEWLAAELNSKYRLPKKDGQRWLKERRILPLLDGLDEVKAENRAACVEKINQLVTDYGLQGMAVCSRIKDYTDLDVRLAFYRAIYIQPLTPEQVDEYLDRAGDKLASLRATLQADEALRNMAQSPLILNIMSLAYQNTSAAALSDRALNTDKARRRHLFDTYIARMFSRKAGTRQYENEQTKQGLSWLARNMLKHNQEIFLIDGLQPSWLSARAWRWIYVFVCRILSGLIFALSFGVSFGVYATPNFWWIGNRIMGFIVGLSAGFIDISRFEWLRKQKGMSNSYTLWWSLIYIVVVFLISTLIFGLLFGTRNSEVTLLSGLIFSLLFGIRSSTQNLENDIRTVETLRWSWRKAGRGGLFGGILGWLLGLLLELSTGAGLRFGIIEWLTNMLIEWVIFGTIFGLIGGIFSGLRPEIIETKSHPNEGIGLSIRNTILGGLIGTLVGPIIGQALGAMFWQGDYVIAGLSSGLIGASWYGGLDVIQHYTLRCILIIQGYTPANYARFLNYAVDRIFLQKVGGGYRFIHRLLLEHFAEMGETKKV